MTKWTSEIALLGRTSVGALRLHRRLVISVALGMLAVAGVASVNQYRQVRDIAELALVTTPAADALHVASMAPEYFLAISPSRWAEMPAVIAGASIVGALLAAVIGAKFAEGFAVRSDLYTLARVGRTRWTISTIAGIEAALLVAVLSLGAASWVGTLVASASLNTQLSGAAQLLRSAHVVSPAALFVAWVAASLPAATAFMMAVALRSAVAGMLLTSGLWMVQALAGGNLPHAISEWFPLGLQTAAVRGAVPDAIPVTLISLMDIPSPAIHFIAVMAALAVCTLAMYWCSSLITNRGDI